MNNKKGINNNSNHNPVRNIIPPMVQNSGANNGVNRTNGNFSATAQNGVPVPNTKRQVAVGKRKANNEMPREESTKAPRIDMQAWNGLQKSNVAQAMPNIGSASIDKYGHYPLNFDSTNLYNNNTSFESYKPSFPNSQYIESNCNNNSYHYQGGNLTYGINNNNAYNTDFNNTSIVTVNTQQVTGNQSNEDLNKQSELQRQRIENCQDLSNQYFDEGKYELCWQEAEKGLNLLGCSNDEKIDFYINISLACNKLKEYARVQQVVYAAVGLPECSNVHKVGLYNTLSLAYTGLKYYVGAQQVIKVALNLPECSNAQKIVFHTNLSFGYNEQKEFAKAKQAAEAALELPECSNIRKIVLYNNLSMACIGLKEYVQAQIAIEAALELPECSDEQKIKLSLNLVKVLIGLKNYAGAKQAINVVLVLPNCNDAQKSHFNNHLSLACFKLGDYTEAQKYALNGLAFLGCESRRKAQLLGIVLKCDNKGTPEEGLNLIICILAAVKNVANDVEKKEAINFLEEVISIKEIITMLFPIAESKLDVESHKSIWKTIEAFAQLKQL